MSIARIVVSPRSLLTVSVRVKELVMMIANGSMARIAAETSLAKASLFMASI